MNPWYLARDDCSTHRFWKDPTSMELKKLILEKDPTAISTFVDQMWWNKGMNHIDCPGLFRSFCPLPGRSQY